MAVTRSAVFTGTAFSFASTASAILLAVALTACAPTPQSAQDQARDIAEQWVAASDRGDEDSAQALSCGAILGGVNSDTAGSQSHALDITPQDDGDFIVQVTKSYSDHPDLVSELGVRTDGDVCIAWVR